MDEEQVYRDNKEKELEKKRKESGYDASRFWQHLAIARAMKPYPMPALAKAQAEAPAPAH